MSDRAATPAEHKANAPQSIGCWVLTISDSKTRDTDTSGTLIRRLLADAGHRVVGFEIVRDEPAEVQRVVGEACRNAHVQALLMTGGTGITSRDATFEAVEELLEKRLPGFGELFRMLSYQEIGDILNIPAKTAESRMRLAHQALRDLLQEQLDRP